MITELTLTVCIAIGFMTGVIVGFLYLVSLIEKTDRSMREDNVPNKPGHPKNQEKLVYKGHEITISKTGYNGNISVRWTVQNLDHAELITTQQMDKDVDPEHILNAIKSIIDSGIIYRGCYGEKS